MLREPSAKEIKALARRAGAKATVIAWASDGKMPELFAAPKPRSRAAARYWDAEGVLFETPSGAAYVVEYETTPGMGFDVWSMTRTFSPPRRWIKAQRSPDSSNFPEFEDAVLYAFPRARNDASNARAKSVTLDEVRAAIARVPSGDRWGDKVFISDAYAAYKAGGGTASRATFNQAILTMRSGGELRLSRADLVPAMPRRKVDASETPYLNARFHFLE